MIFKEWSESYEQAKVVEFLEVNNYKFSSIPNSTFTKSWKQKVANKALWVRPWLSDLLILLKRGSILFLEMKKQKWVKWGMNGSSISEYQLSWQESINMITNAQYEIAHGASEAIDLIQDLDNN